MSSVILMTPARATDLQFKARLAGAFYAITFVTGSAAFFMRGTTGTVLGLTAALAYIAVTVLFYELFKHGNRAVALVAAVISLLGCAYGPLGMFGLAPFPINSLVFFGAYCSLLAYLILKSQILPRFLGVLMAFAGIGWLTFAWPSLAALLSPFNMLPGVVGEGCLTLWLLIRGVR